MTAAEMTAADAVEAAAWMSARIDLPFGADWFSRTGIAVRDGDLLRFVVIVYFEQTAPVAVVGWAMANPANTPRQSREAAALALGSVPAYAKARGAKYLLSYLGTRGLNRILSGFGLINGDAGIEQKFLKLR